MPDPEKVVSNVSVAPAPTTDQLYSQYGQMVLRRARAMLGDEQAARDAAQEIFVKVLQAMAAFRAEASPVTWLYRTTTNHCLNLLRDGRRRSQALDAMSFFASDEREPGLDERLTLHAVLAGVAEPLREIAVYYYLDQMSHDEIAQLIGVSRRTVGNRLVEFHTAAKLAAKARRMCP